MIFSNLNLLRIFNLKNYDLMVSSSIFNFNQHLFIYFQVCFIIYIILITIIIYLLCYLVYHKITI